MKIVLFLMITVSLFSQRYGRSHYNDCNHCDRRSCDVSWGNRDVEDGEMLIRKRGRIYVRIERDGSLYIRNREMDIDSGDKRLLRRYVRLYEEMIDLGIELGKDGASMGIYAAAKAIRAIATLDIDDMEERIEQMEDDIEEKAEELEERAEELEEIAEEFMDVRCRLKNRIEELDDLDDF